MKINWNVEECNPASFSCIIFSNAKRLIESIKNCGTVVFVVKKHTKTSLDIEIWSGEKSCEDMFIVAHIPNGGEKFKYLTQTHMNYFEGKSSTRHYFKLTKTQRTDELKEYLTCVLNDLQLNLDELDANLRIINVPELNAVSNS